MDMTPDFIQLWFRNLCGSPADVAALQCRGLTRLATWEMVATLSGDERRALWPRSDIDSPQHLWLGLHCAPEKGPE